LLAKLASATNGQKISICFERIILGFWYWRRRGVGRVEIDVILDIVPESKRHDFLRD
jgi:hypothetical protein